MKKCPECKISFKSFPSYFKHLKEKHPAVLLCLVFDEEEKLRERFQE
jgi:uncharacterized C2H2 Zn-finger protein